MTKEGNLQCSPFAKNDNKIWKCSSLPFAGALQHLALFFANFGVAPVFFPKKKTPSKAGQRAPEVIAKSVQITIEGGIRFGVWSGLDWRGFL